MSEKDIINDTEIEEVKDAGVLTGESGREDDKKEEYEKVCFICHRPESVTGKMIDLPNHISVCPDCMQKSFDVMNSGQIDFSQLMNMP